MGLRAPNQSVPFDPYSQPQQSVQSQGVQDPRFFVSPAAVTSAPNTVRVYNPHYVGNTRMWNVEGLKDQRPGQKITLDEQALRMQGIQIPSSDGMEAPLGTGEKKEAQPTKLQVTDSGGKRTVRGSTPDGRSFEQTTNPDGTTSEKVTMTLPAEPPQQDSNPYQFQDEQVGPPQQQAMDQAQEQPFPLAHLAGSLDYRPYMKIWDNLEGTDFAKGNLDPAATRMKYAQARQMDASARKMLNDMGTPDLRRDKLQLERDKLQLERDQLEEKIKSGGVTPMDAVRMDLMKARIRGIDDKINNPRQGILQQLIDKDLYKDLREKLKRRQSYNIGGRMESTGFYHDGETPIEQRKNISKARRTPRDGMRILGQIDKMLQILDTVGDPSELFERTEIQGAYNNAHQEVMDTIKNMKLYGALQKFEVKMIENKLGPKANTPSAFLEKHVLGLKSRLGKLKELQMNISNEVTDEMIGYGYDTNDMWQETYGKYTGVPLKSADDYIPSNREIDAWTDEQFDHWEKTGENPVGPSMEPLDLRQGGSENDGR